MPSKLIATTLFKANTTIGATTPLRLILPSVRLVVAAHETANRQLGVIISVVDEIANDMTVGNNYTPKKLLMMALIVAADESANTATCGIKSGC